MHSSGSARAYCLSNHDRCRSARASTRPPRCPGCWPGMPAGYRADRRRQRLHRRLGRRSPRRTGARGRHGRSAASAPPRHAGLLAATATRLLHGRRRLARPGQLPPVADPVQPARPTSCWAGAPHTRAAPGRCTPGSATPCWPGGCAARRRAACTTSGPMRAARREALLALELRDRRSATRWRWCVRAAGRAGGSPRSTSPTRPARGARSKVTGTVRGTARTVRDMRGCSPRSRTRPRRRPQPRRAPAPHSDPGPVVTAALHRQAPPRRRPPTPGALKPDIPTKAQTPSRSNAAVSYHLARVIAKEPVPGRVKTRLTPPFTPRRRSSPRRRSPTPWPRSRRPRSRARVIALEEPRAAGCSRGWT